MRKYWMGLASYAVIAWAIAALVVSASCGRTVTPLEVERACPRVMVVTDTIWLEPGHVIGGYVLEPACSGGK